MKNLLIKINLSLFFVFGLCYSSTQVIGLKRFALNLNNDVTLHQEGGKTRVGGYYRYLTTSPWSYETLVDGAIASNGEEVIRAKLRVRMVGGNMGGRIWPMVAYEQNKLNSWDRNTVNFKTFDTKWWTKRLGETKIGSSYTSNGTWVEIEGQGITDWVKATQDQNEANRKGLILTSAMMTYLYYAEMDSVQIEVETRPFNANAITKDAPLVRAWNFGFSEGNLIANWSFENVGGGWIGTNIHALANQLDKNICGGCAAKTGSYVAYVGAPNASLMSKDIPVEAGSEYSLTWNTLGQSNSIEPSIEFLDDAGYLLSSTSSIKLAPLPSSKRWVRGSFKFTPPVGCEKIRITYANQVSANTKLMFDDIRLEKANVTQKVNEAVSFMDGFGRNHQNAILLEKRYSSKLLLDACLDGVAVHGKTGVNLDRFSWVYGGDVHSENTINGAEESHVSGDLRSVNRITMGIRSTITGNIQSKINEVNMGAESIFAQGSISNLWDQSPCTQFTLPGTRTAGTQNLSYSWTSDKLIAPQVYNNLTSSGTTLTFKSGRYDFNSINIAADSKIILDLAEGDIEFYVSSINIGDRVNMEVKNRNSNYAVRWNVFQSNDMRLGSDAFLFGFWYLPNANLALGARSYLEGALISGKQTSLETEAVVSLSAGIGLEPSNRYLVQGTEYDEYGRATKSTLPWQIEMKYPAVIDDKVTLANTYYDGIKMPNAGSRAFNEANYNDLTLPFGKKIVQLNTSGNTAPGALWSTRTSNSGSALVRTLDIPTALPNEYNTGYIAKPSNDIRDIDLCSYGGIDGVNCNENLRLSWAKNPEGKWVLSWSRIDGLVVKKAESRFVASSESEWKANEADWLITTFDYFENGLLKKSLSPLDRANQANHSGSFNSVYFYDQNGNVLATRNSQGRIAQQWYDIANRVKFWQDGELRDQNRYGFIDRDSLGRTTAIGTIELPSSMTMEQALEQHSIVGLNRIDEKLYFYDNADAWTAYFGEAPEVLVQNMENRMWAQVNLNPSLALPEAVLSNPKERRVANFYNFDDEGRLTSEYLYIGASRNSAHKISRIEYVYDELERLKEKRFFVGLTSTDAATVQKMFYDEEGRLNVIKDKDDQVVSSKTYDDFGRMTETAIGPGLKFNYKWHLQGWMTEMSARKTNGTLLFKQQLAYEAPAISQSPVNQSFKPQLDGRISQSAWQYGTGVVGTNQAEVQVFNMGYDAQERMNSSRYYTAPSGSVDALGQLKSTASLSETNELAETVSYDESGSILTKSNSGQTLTYHYQPNSFELNKVLGTFPDAKDRSLENNYIYDLNGRLIYDAGANRLYSWNSQEMRGVSERNYDRTEGEFYLYDASGWRVMSLHYLDTPLNAPEGSGLHRMNGTRSYYYRLGGQVQAEMSEPLWGPSGVEFVYALNGHSGRVGDVMVKADGSQTKRYYVQNHQGSLLLTVDASGSPINGYRKDYSPYGREFLRQASSQSEPTEGYTGKQYNAWSGLTYFGARYYDPALGVWLAKDAAKEFMNPYARGGDPVNYLDPDGNCEILCIMAIGAAIAFVVKTGAEAYENEKEGQDWYDVSEYDWDEIAKTTIAGAAVAGGGAYIYGAGAAATGAWGTTVAVSQATAVTAFAFSLPSYIGRMTDPDNESKLGTTSDYFLGGFLVNGLGHMYGQVNTLFGGDYEWHRGNIVYEGAAKGSSFAHFGTAIFTDDLSDKHRTAHELAHVRQMEKTGFRPVFWGNYLIEGKGSFTGGLDNPDYVNNSYEISGYYHEYRHEMGCETMYGKETANAGRCSESSFILWYQKRTGIRLSPDQVTDW